MRKLGLVATVAMTLMLAACTSSASRPTTTTSPTTQAEAPHVTATAVAGAAGYLWLLGTYPCPTGTCPVVMRSTDGGKSFVRVGSPPLSVDAVEFANREDGYAYGAQGSDDETALYWTGDGGKTWRLALAQFREERPSAVVVASGRAYVLVPKDCSAYGQCKSLELASSAVTGDTWTITPLRVDAANNLVGLAAFGSKVWLITTLDGGSYAVLLVSDDGGRSFANLPSTGMLGLGCYATATSAMTLWGFCPTGSLGYPVRSTDRGRDFTTMSGWNRGHHRPAGNGGLIFPLSDNEAVFEPNGQGMWLTRDGGAHFSFVRFSSLWQSHSYGFYITFASATTWLVLGVRQEPGENSLMWRTTNGGRSWQSVKTPSVSKPLPTVDLSATPAGWVPVDYSLAQISVPATWWYESPTTGRCPGGPIRGLVLVLVGAVHPGKNTCPHPAPAASFASVASAGLVEIADHRLKPTVVNGIPVYVQPGGLTYYVPSLDIQVHASGPSARRVLHTLTWSPAAVALSQEPTKGVPASWRWYTFAGLRFAAPPNLPKVTSDDIGPGCPQVVPGLAREVLLSTATTLGVTTRCIVLRTKVSLIRYGDGVLVASGPYQSVQLPKKSQPCRSLHGLRACVTSGTYGGVLELIVAVPGRSRPTLVEIGLAGNGMVARTILYSLRAA